MFSRKHITTTLITFLKNLPAREVELKAKMNLIGFIVWKIVSVCAVVLGMVCTLHAFVSKSDRKQNLVNIFVKPDGILNNNKLMYKLERELN